MARSIRPDNGKGKVLIQGLATGRRAAWEELYRIIYARILKRGRRLTRDEEQAKDLAHDAFLAVFTREVAGRRQNKPIKNPGPYLERVLITQYLKILQSPWQAADMDALREDTDESRESEHPVSIKTPHDAVELEELAKKILECLSPVQRRVLLLRYVVGLSVGEIASQLGKNEKSIESIVYRTKTALREKFGDQWDAE